jgi:hypothetical protein
MCILISLAIHIALLNHSKLTQKLKPKSAALIVAVAEAEPVPPPPARPTPQPEPQRSEDVAETSPQMFRPNIEQEDPEEDQTQEVADAEEDETAQPEQSEPEKSELAEAELPEAELPKEPQAEKRDFKQDIAKYRKQLLDEFKDEWQKVPELNTVIRDLTLLPRIDSHFGIVILAYSFVEHKPGPPFVIFNADDASFQQVDSFDFSSFSNRIKDRMLYTQYRRLLEQARQDYKINSLMTMIGLVPIETDHYFSAKQLRAVQLAGLSLDRVAATNGHYEPDGSDGFNLIIDTVVAADGRSVSVQDEELKFSVVAKR